MLNEVNFDAANMTWIQFAQNNRREIKGQRSVNLPLLEDRDAVYAAVESFAEFVAKSGGDVEVSLLAALDDLQQISKVWIAKVDKGGSEADIRLAGGRLKQVIELYKAMDSYYEINFWRAAAAGD